MSLSEEMDEAAEKEGQAEKNRKQAEENRQRIEALEETLRETLEDALGEALEEKVEGLNGDLKEDLGQTVGQMKEELGQMVSQMVEKKLSSAEEAIEALADRLDQGVEAKQPEEMKDLRQKIGRYLRIVDLRKEQEKTMSDEIQRLRRRKNRMEQEVRERQLKLDSAERTIRNSTETIRTAARWSPAMGLIGGLVGAMMLALLTRGGYPILPQGARMTPSEISRVESSRYLSQVESQMTEDEYDQYQRLLKKAEKRLQERQD